MSSIASKVNVGGVGRRKSSVARVWIRPGSGSFVINGKDSKDYFPAGECLSKVQVPAKVVAKENFFDVVVNVFGGGHLGQADAIKLGFSRALVAFDEQTRPALKAAGLLTVDARLKERKKPGMKAARRRFQFVKR